MRNVCVATLEGELPIAWNVCLSGDVLVAKERISRSLGIDGVRQVGVLPVHVVVPVHLPVPVEVVWEEARVLRDAVAVLGHAVGLHADPDLAIAVFTASHAGFVGVQAGGIRIQIVCLHPGGVTNTSIVTSASKIRSGCRVPAGGSNLARTGVSKEICNSVAVVF